MKETYGTPTGASTKHTFIASRVILYSILLLNLLLVTNPHARAASALTHITLYTDAMR